MFSVQYDLPILSSVEWISPYLVNAVLHKVFELDENVVLCPLVYHLYFLQLLSVISFLAYVTCYVFARMKNMFTYITIIN